MSWLAAAFNMGSNWQLPSMSMVIIITLIIDQCWVCVAPGVVQRAAGSVIEWLPVMNPVGLEGHVRRLENLSLIG